MDAVNLEKKAKIDDVLNSPPKGLLIWGNLLFLVMIIGGIFISSILHVKIKVQLPAQVVHVLKTNDKVLKVTLLADLPEQTNIGHLKHQHILVDVAQYPVNSFGLLNGVVSDHVLLDGNKKLNVVANLTLKNKGKEMFPYFVKSGMFVQIEIITGETTVLKNLWKKLSN